MDAKAPDDGAAASGLADDAVDGPPGVVEIRAPINGWVVGLVPGLVIGLRGATVVVGLLTVVVDVVAVVVGVVDVGVDTPVVVVTVAEQIAA